MNHYAKRPECMKPGVMTALTKIQYGEDGPIEVAIPKIVCLNEELVKYAENDTDVLPYLYASVDKLCKEELGANVTSFLTSGSAAWYGFMINLPNSCLKRGSKYTE